MELAPGASAFAAAGSQPGLVPISVLAESQGNYPSGLVQQPRPMLSSTLASQQQVVSHGYAAILAQRAVPESTAHAFNYGLFGQQQETMNSLKLNAILANQGSTHPLQDHPPGLGAALVPFAELRAEPNTTPHGAAHAIFDQTSEPLNQGETDSRRKVSPRAQACGSGVLNLEGHWQASSQHHVAQPVGVASSSMLPITAQESPHFDTAIEVQGAIANAPGISLDGLHTSLSTGNLDRDQEANARATTLFHSGNDVVTALYSNWHRNLTGRKPESLVTRGSATSSLAHQPSL